METLTDFKPLERVTLPDLGELDCSGLILIVGPNSSGKSQFLHDIHKKVMGQPRDSVVAKDIKIRRFDHKSLLECLSREKYISTWEDDNGTPHIRPMTTYLGTGEPVQQVTTNQTESWYSTYSSSDNIRTRRKDEYLGYFARFLVAALFLERRLSSVNQVGIIDFVNQPPQQDLHALYLNDKARLELFNELKASFSKAVWPDTSQGNTLCLRVSDRSEMPSAEDRLSPQKMSKYRTIETEGDGLKSYVAISIALILGQRPVCLLDEPEMCLHPPQAYNLGRFIGRFGTSKENVTFVATHSSHILRGVIETAPKLQIVRLTRLDGNFHAHLVSAETLEDSLKKPNVRAESVLDGIFSQAVIVLEADGDRTVYSAVWDTLSDQPRLDAHFTAVGGTGGIADTCALYTNLNIPVAVIADLDILTDEDKLKRILASLGQESKELLEEVRRIVAEVKLLPPTISPDEIKKELSEITSGPMDWKQRDDEALRSKLYRIARSIDRMRRLKHGGVSILPPELSKRVEKLIDDLHTAGIFVVPVGELEEWLETAEIAASKENKWAWANEAALHVRKLGSKEEDIWSFVRKIRHFLQDRFASTAA